jgi:hypothetical protein
MTRFKYKRRAVPRLFGMSKNVSNPPCPTSSPAQPNTICGLYGSTHEPLHPTTRTFKRQLMERTVSDLLVKLDYTGLKLSEAKKQCRVLQSVLQIKNEEMDALMNELRILKKERQEVFEDYHDLHLRYQERVEDLRRISKLK